MITQEEYEEAQEIVWDYEDQLKEQGKAFDTSEEQALNIDIVSQRYFIVSYISNVVRGSMTGNLDVVTNGEYLNRVLTIENIRESIKQDCSDIVITNIIELSKIDYESWSSNVG